MTQEDLALASHRRAISISRYERDDKRPSRDALERLGEALGVSPAWLLTGEGRGPRAAKVA